MAKFNQSRYNLAPYNRFSGGDVVFDKIQIDALFQAFIGLGQKTKDTLRMDVVFTAQAKMASGTIEQSTLSAIVEQEVIGRYIAFSHDTITSSFSAEAYMSPRIHDELTLPTEFLPEIYLGPKVRDVIEMDAEVEGETYLGNKIRDIYPIMAYALFSATMSAEAYEEYILDLSVTIPPDGVLVIDSDNFRVLLNDVNAIKYHSGDWADALNRTTKSIIIQGGGDSLESSIYYQELWL